MKKYFLFLVMIFLNSGCNFSPLLRHTNAEDIVPNRLKSERAITKCQLTQTQQKNQDPEKECQFYFEKEKLCATIEWKKVQTTDEPGEFYIFFWDPNAANFTGPYLNPTDEKSVNVKLWMATMGHGSSPVQVDSCIDESGKSAAGVFIAKNVWFVMRGPWEIWLQLKKDKNLEEEKKIDFTY